MIVYNLRCPKDHVFEAWFRDSAAYDDQSRAGEVFCPTCGSKKVEIPRTVELACYALSRGVSRFDGRIASNPSSALANSRRKMCSAIRLMRSLTSGDLDWR